MTKQEQITKIQKALKSHRAQLLTLASGEGSQEDLEIAAEEIALMRSHKRRLACLTGGK